MMTAPANMVLAYVQGVPVRALVDTGAVVSVVSAQVFRKITKVGAVREILGTY